MTDGPIARYRAMIDAHEIERDPVQEMAAEKLQLLHHRLRTYDPTARRKESRGWFGFGAKAAKPEDPLSGLYLFGGVGRGKSMLMDLFYEGAPVTPKRRVHFHAFMIETHAAIAKARAAGAADPIPPVAQDHAERATLLCFDELQVTDIADAMILARLFTALFDMGVVVVATSNRPPDDLYKDGLNRQLFLPFIALLKSRIDVLELESRRDYRLLRMQGVEVFHHPLGAAADAAMDAAWSRLTGDAPGRSVVLEVQGRNVEAPRTAMGVARFTFDELCARPLGAADYLEICWNFHTLLIDRIPRLTPERRNEARRFVTLIDAMYENRRKLVCSADAPVDALYPEGDGAFEFARTASRLHEMGARDWITNT